MMVYKRVKSTSHIRFHTKVKVLRSSLVQELVLLVHAGSVELVSLVQGGHLQFEHDCELLRHTCLQHHAPLHEQITNYIIIT